MLNKFEVRKWNRSWIIGHTLCKGAGIEETQGTSDLSAGLARNYSDPMVLNVPQETKVVLVKKLHVECAVKMENDQSEIIQID